MNWVLALQLDWPGLTGGLTVMPLEPVGGGGSEPLEAWQPGVKLMSSMAMSPRKLSPTLASTIIWKSLE